MALFEWHKNLEIGDKHIDSQHKRLIEVTNELVAACNNNQGKDKLLETLRFLADYAVKHFRDEEKLAQSVNYPGYAEHKKIHDKFKETVTESIKQLESEGANIMMIAKTNMFISNWLINHVSNEDAKIGAYIRELSLTH